MDKNNQIEVITLMCVLAILIYVSRSKNSTEKQCLNLGVTLFKESSNNTNPQESMKA